MKTSLLYFQGDPTAGWLWMSLAGVAAIGLIGEIVKFRGRFVSLLLGLATLAGVAYVITDGFNQAAMQALQGNALPALEGAGPAVWTVALAGLMYLFAVIVRPKRTGRAWLITPVLLVLAVGTVLVTIALAPEGEVDDGGIDGSDEAVVLPHADAPDA